jgi:hypothetical protein
MDIVAMMQYTEEIKCELIRIFRLDDYAQNSRSCVLVDMYFHALEFTRDHCFSKEQTACFLSILRQIHDVCVETPFDNMCECFKFLQGLVLCHSVQRPPFSIELFNLDQARHVTQYVIKTYFRHFKLYKYVFTPDVSLDLVIGYPNAPLTPEPIIVEVGEAQPDGDESLQQKKSDEHSEEAAKKEEESEECSTLRKLIRQQLNEELEKLRSCLDETLCEKDTEVDQRIKNKESISENDSTDKEASEKKTKKKKQK